MDETTRLFFKKLAIFGLPVLVVLSLALTVGAMGLNLQAGHAASAPMGSSGCPHHH